MKVNLYDFDDTIYKGNSLFHFFKFCYKRGFIKNSQILKIPGQAFLFKTKNITRTEFHDYMFSWVKDIPNIEAILNEFWELHKKNIKDFYLEKADKSNDIILSASPEFLLKWVVKDLNLKDLIGSDFDLKTAKNMRTLCHGEEKVVQLEKKYPKAIVSEAYGNSFYDIPYMKLAEKAYMLKGNKIIDLKDYKLGLFNRLWRWGWDIHNKNHEIWNYLIAGGLTTIVSIFSFALFSRTLGIHFIFANILSWILAVIFAYFVSRWFVFRAAKDRKIIEFLGFIGSRIFTLLLDTGLMILLVGLFLVDDVLSKILASIVVLIANYLISKFVIFRKA